MLMANTEPLYGKTPDELSELCARLGLPRYAPRQIARWLYVRAVADPAAMTDLSRAARGALAAACAPGRAPPGRGGGEPPSPARKKKNEKEVIPKAITFVSESSFFSKRDLISKQDCRSL